MSEDPLLNGEPISTLKVVDLRRELDNLGLPKAGNKKELFERLRDHLNSTSTGKESAEEDDESGGRRTRSSASPRKTPASPTKTSTKAASPTKSPPVVNKFVAQYLQNQQATLQEAKRGAELLREASATDKDEAVVEGSQRSEAISQREDSQPSTTSIEDAASVESVADDVSSTVVEMGDLPKVDKDMENQIIETSSIENTMEEESATVEPPIAENPPDESAEKMELDATREDEENVREPAHSGLDEQMETSAVGASEEKPDSAEKEGVSMNDVTSSRSSSSASSRKGSSSVSEEGEDKMEAATAVESPVHAPEKMETAGEQSGKKRPTIVWDVEEKPAAVKKEAEPGITFRKSIELIRKQPVTVEEDPKYGTNALGNIRVRPASPARMAPSEYIQVTQLKRPYVVASLQAALRTFGDFSDDDFWIDNLRSTCIVKYDSVENATKAREELHNVRWPDAKGPMILVDFTTDDKMQQRRSESVGRRSESGMASRKESLEKSGIIIRLPNDRTLSSEHDDASEKDNVSEKSTESRKRTASTTKKSLDELFKKTKAMPHIYYLPLTEEEAVARKQQSRRRR